MTSRAGVGGIVIDARAGRRIGAGHVVRTLELARRLRKKGHHVTFLPARGASPLERQGTFPVLPLALIRHAPALVLIDRPDASPALFARHRRRWPEARLVVLDYYGRLEGDVRAVININAARERHHTRQPTKTIHARGLGYAILRDSFLRQRRQVSRAGSASRIGICFGGTDPFDWTGRTVSAMAPWLRASGVTADVVIGRWSSNVSHTARAFGNSVRVHVAVKDPAPLFARCSMLVTGGGTLMMEAACLGIASVVVPRTPEELAFAAQFQSAGAATIVEGRFRADAVARSVSRLALSNKERHGMSAAGRRLVDGKGADRVVALIVAQMRART